MTSGDRSRSAGPQCLLATETGRSLDEALLPEESAVSVVTVTELHAGVLAAPDVETRARRLATLDVVSDIEILPIDADVARVWARLRVSLAEAGRRINVNDLWIAATAARHGICVVTQDGDFQPVDGGLRPISMIRSRVRR